VKLEGFPRSERVRRSEEFTRILQQGERLRGQFLTAFWILDDHPVNRVGVAAGKRLGNAAVRNRLKRRTREAYRRNKRKLPCRGVAIIFMASSKMIGKSESEVESEITWLLGEISTSLESRSGPCTPSSSSTGE
jgi:ribonuclease P protein component